MKIRILGLGNPMLSDDAIGIHVSRFLSTMDLDADIEVFDSEAGGMNLLDEFIGCSALIIVDSIITRDSAPGFIHEYTLDNLPFSKRVRCAHDADIGSTIKLGRKLGMDLPKVVRVIAIEIKDNLTFSEQMTPSVKDAVKPASSRVLNMALALKEELVLA
jgi:hydrogenase maturation protease